MAQATTAELIEVLAPFVGVRLSRGPRASGVHVRCDGLRRLDADVREVTAEGVTFYFDGRGEFEPWSDVVDVTVFVVEGEHRLWREVAAYEHVGDGVRRAA